MTVSDNGLYYIPLKLPCPTLRRLPQWHNTTFWLLNKLNPASEWILNWLVEAVQSYRWARQLCKTSGSKENCIRWNCFFSLSRFNHKHTHPTPKYLFLFLHTFWLPNKGNSSFLFLEFVLYWRWGCQNRASFTSENIIHTISPSLCTHLLFFPLTWQWLRDPGEKTKSSPYTAPSNNCFLFLLFHNCKVSQHRGKKKLSVTEGVRTW